MQRCLQRQQRRRAQPELERVPYKQALVVVLQGERVAAVSVQIDREPESLVLVDPVK
jgi:hypothetical protein